ncbi:MAG: hypothetical protein C0626_05825 [Arcobacter sp.]|uniref:glycosyltransferase family A protein n=1 Tax=uncultured Arcobacter sp. TaxID=165434 RepID=UPI000CB6E6F6|nr:glycosyltransferase family 2 protein [uncultured Arcobacter sp.]PLY10492.1 MAG: hypothetical protein C0626_05825 [Arcobacter sp.]
MKKPLVSILMNCYNCQKYLEEAIQSVYSQSYTNWEIIFIDNCSTDKSKTIVDKFDSKIKYYKTPYNMNLCNARVFAKEFIYGEFFCVLDTDDLWMPDKLEKQIKVMLKNDDIGIVYSNTIYFNDLGVERLAYDKKMPSGKIFEELLSNYFFSFETVMVRKSLMDKYKIYFNSKYNVSSDAELFIKLSYYTQSYYLDKPLAKWRYGHGSESDRSLCLFPREYEVLLKDLSNMIENFEIEYKTSIQKLQTKINNMYGMCEWSRNNKSKSRQYLSNAIKKEKKYLIPYILSFFMSYTNYVNLRRKFKKL